MCLLRSRPRSILKRPCKRTGQRPLQRPVSNAVSTAAAERRVYSYAAITASRLFYERCIIGPAQQHCNKRNPAFRKLRKKCLLPA